MELVAIAATVVVVLAVVLYVWHKYPTWFNSAATTVVNDANKDINAVKAAVSNTTASNTVVANTTPVANTGS